MATNPRTAVNVEDDGRFDVHFFGWGVQIKVHIRLVFQPVRNVAVGNRGVVLIQKDGNARKRNQAKKQDSNARFFKKALPSYFFEHYFIIYAKICLIKQKEFSTDLVPKFLIKNNTINRLRMLRFATKSFNQLSLNELYDIMKLRQEIFVVEQNCPYLDADGYDQKATHVLGISEGDKLAAYIRIFAPGDYYDEAAIGRVVVNADFRGKQRGVDIMQRGIDYCKKHFPNSPIKIGAQVYLDKFYRSLGFVPVSEMYLEDGIEHQYMVLAPIP